MLWLFEARSRHTGKFKQPQEITARVVNTVKKRQAVATGPGAYARLCLPLMTLQKQRKTRATTD